MKRLGKQLFLLAQPLLVLYFRLYPTPRTRIIVTDDRGNVLLSKGWFSSQQWELPGGGIKKGESPRQAVQRELQEETGLRVEAAAIDDLGTVLHTTDRLRYQVLLFSCHIPSLQQVKLGSDRWWEIAAVDYFPIHKLPHDTGTLVHRSLLRARDLNG